MLSCPEHGCLLEAETDITIAPEIHQGTAHTPTAHGAQARPGLGPAHPRGPDHRHGHPAAQARARRRLVPAAAHAAGRGQHLHLPDPPANRPPPSSRSGTPQDGRPGPGWGVAALRDPRDRTPAGDAQNRRDRAEPRPDREGHRTRQPRPAAERPTTPARLRRRPAQRDGTGAQGQTGSHAPVLDASPASHLEDWFDTARQDPGTARQMLALLTIYCPNQAAYDRSRDLVIEAGVPPEFLPLSKDSLTGPALS